MSFAKEKLRRLQRIDQSRKGCIDSQIENLVTRINEQDDYVTTSSCSGRIVILAQNELATGGFIQKRNCQWLLISHEPVKEAEVIAALKSHSGCAIFKFEPFVLHVQAASLQAGQKMHSASIASGFRNSGLTISGAGRITLAVRSTHVMEVPLSENGNLLVSTGYISFMVKKANEKMEENQRRISRFALTLEKIFANSRERQDNEEQCSSHKKKDICKQLLAPTNQSRNVLGTRALPSDEIYLGEIFADTLSDSFAVSETVQGINCCQ